MLFLNALSDRLSSNPINLIQRSHVSSTEVDSGAKKNARSNPFEPKNKNMIFMRFGKNKAIDKTYHDLSTGIFTTINVVPKQQTSDNSIATQQTKMLGNIILLFECWMPYNFRSTRSFVSYASNEILWLKYNYTSIKTIILNWLV